jgi:PAS domain S-box-containing protein
MVEGDNPELPSQGAEPGPNEDPISLDAASRIFDVDRQTLRHAIDFLHYLMTQSPMAIYRADRRTFITTYITPNVTRILGYRPDEVVGIPYWWANVMHPDDRQQLVPVAASGSHSVGSDFWVYRMRHKDGSYRWVRTTAKVERGAAGEELGLIGFLLDITDQKEAEAAGPARESPPTVGAADPTATAGLPTRLRWLMGVRGLHQRQLARQAGVSDASVSRLLSGRNPNPTTRLLQALAGALKVSVHDLLGAALSESAAPSGEDEAIALLLRSLRREDRARVLGYIEALVGA